MLKVPLESLQVSSRPMIAVIAAIAIARAAMVRPVRRGPGDRTAV